MLINAVNNQFNKKATLLKRYRSSGFVFNSKNKSLINFHLTIKKKVF